MKLHDKPAKLHPVHNTLYGNVIKVIKVGVVLFLTYKDKFLVLPRVVTFEQLSVQMSA